MTKEELLREWPNDVRELLRFKRERELEEWPSLPTSNIPGELIPLVGTVCLLCMRWDDVVELKREGVLSKPFIERVDGELGALEERIYEWDVATGPGDPWVLAVRRYCEAVDTALFLNKGVRYLDASLRA